MLAKKIALGVGLALILPLLIYYGVSVVNPPPKWDAYSIPDYGMRYEHANPTEKVQMADQNQKLQQEYRIKRADFEKKLFYAALPLGLLAIVVGSVLGAQALSSGLIFGGVFTLIQGYFIYWSQLPDWMCFVSLLVAFVVLIFFARSRYLKENNTKN